MSTTFSALVWWIIPITALSGVLGYVLWVTKFQERFENETTRSVTQFQRFQSSFREAQENAARKAMRTDTVLQHRQRPENDSHFQVSSAIPLNMQERRELEEHRNISAAATSTAEANLAAIHSASRNAEIARTAEIAAIATRKAEEEEAASYKRFKDAEREQKMKDLQAQLDTLAQERKA